MVDKKRKGISLIVDEAYQEDIDKGIVRIDSQIMKKLDLSVGDIVLIKGAYEDMETAAIVQRAYPSDIGNNNIRMDPITRRNAGTSVGEKVFIQKVEEISIAKKIILSPIRKNVEITLLDEDDGMQIRRGTRGEKELIKISPRIINRTLYKKPLTKGDIVSIGSLVSRRRTSPFNDDLGSVFSEIERIFGGTIGPVSFGSPIKFQVVSVSPKGIVLVTEDTQFSISDKSAIAAGAGVPEIAYEDIGGLDEEIKKVREMIEMPLKHPEIFDKLGVHPPKGVLLYGPPGTGKTLLAKAVAHESSANFILLNGPEIMSKFVGEAEKKLRDIFEKAEKNAPSIIFIDEIDAIAPKREESYGEVERRVVAQLLALMDGLKSRGKVIVIAATNRQDALDPALRRGGRFDREIEIGVPNKKARLEILQIHTRNMPLDKNVDLKHFAEITHGFVGADLEGVVKEAAMNVIRRVIPEYSFKDDEPIPEEVIKKLIVTKNDFKEGLKNVKPSAMREVLVELPKVKWSDIGGLEKAKRDLKEAIEWPLKSPDSFKKMGIRPPRGVLIYGPPGTGKTLLAKAVANESGANFISVKGPEVFSKWVGESEKAIRKIFQKARQVSPCIVFFDEIDAIASHRGADASGNRVGDKVVNQLLTEMNGLEDLSDVVVIAATNRPELVDPALLRPGRFDRAIFVDAPNEKAREEILKVHTKNMPLEKGVNLKSFAKQLEGYSGADIEAIVREAGMAALRENIKANKVRKKHFEEAIKEISPSLAKLNIHRYKETLKNNPIADYLG